MNDRLNIGCAAVRSASYASRLNLMAVSQKKPENGKHRGLVDLKPTQLPLSVLFSVRHYVQYVNGYHLSKAYHPFYP